jgi:hypothetical protein
VNAAQTVSVLRHVLSVPVERRTEAVAHEIAGRQDEPRSVIQRLKMPTMDWASR